MYQLSSSLITAQTLDIQISQFSRVSRILIKKKEKNRDAQNDNGMRKKYMVLFSKKW